MVSSGLFLALATAAATAAAKDTQPLGFDAQYLGSANLLPLGVSHQAVNLAAAYCPGVQRICDSQFCMPSGATCCNLNNGAFCYAGNRCVKDGCCPFGETCIGKPKCGVGRELCGTFCMPEGSVCCKDSGGSYCEKGQSCTSNGCSGGSDRVGGGGSGGDGGSSGGSGSDSDSGSGGSGGSGSGSGSGSDSDSGSGGSGGSGGGSGPRCGFLEEPCGTRCMPEGAVCCNNDKYYCRNGQICGSDDQCTWKDTFGFTSSSRINVATSTVATSTVADSSFPTGLLNGDDDETTSSSSDGPRITAGGGGSSNSDDDDSPRSGDDGSNGGSSGGSNTNGETGAGVVHRPSFAAAVVAVAGLLF